MILNFEYDKELDVIYIYLSDKPYSYTKPLDDTRNIDYAIDDTPIGIELLGVSEGVDIMDLPEQNKVAKLLEAEDIKTLV